MLRTLWSVAIRSPFLVCELQTVKATDRLSTSRKKIIFVILQILQLDFSIKDELMTQTFQLDDAHSDLSKDFLWNRVSSLSVLISSSSTVCNQRLLDTSSRKFFLLTASYYLREWRFDSSKLSSLGNGSADTFRKYRRRYVDVEIVIEDTYVSAKYGCV